MGTERNVTTLIKIFRGIKIGLFAVALLVCVTPAQKALAADMLTTDMMAQGVTAESLINNYKAKLMGATSVEYTKQTNITKALQDSYTSSNLNRQTTETLSFNNGQYYRSVTSNSIGTYADDNYNHTYDENITEIPSYADPVDPKYGFFFINPHGNETLSYEMEMVDGVVTSYYSVKGIVNKADFVNTRDLDPLCELVMDDLTYLNDEYFAMPYEARFNENGDLISLSVNVSPLFRYKVETYQASGMNLTLDTTIYVNNIRVNDPSIVVKTATTQQTQY